VKVVADEAPFQKEILRDKIFDVLQAWILDRTFKPGEKIVESSLAKKLNVSRAPLREALWLLGQRGLVTLRPHQGAFVTKLSDQDIREIFELRELLETHAAKKVRFSLAPEGVERLQEAFNRLAEATRKRDIQLFTAADLAFHKTLWSLSGNKQLERLLTDISTRFFGYELIRDLPQSPRFRFDEMLEEHRKMLNLVMKGTEEAIEAGYKQVFGEFLQYVLARFGEQAQPLPRAGEAET